MKPGGTGPIAGPRWFIEQDYGLPPVEPKDPYED